MSQNEDEFLKRLLSIFKVEADEHLETIYSGLLNLEKESDDKKQIEIIETIYRETHSLKGASRAVDMEDVGSICQSAENLFAALKRREIKTSARLFDTLHHIFDIIGKSLSSSEANRIPQLSELIKQIEDLSTGTIEKEIQPPKSAQDLSSVENRIPEGGDTFSSQNNISPPASTEQIQKGLEVRTQIQEPAIVKLSRIGSTIIEKKATPSETIRTSRKKMERLLLQTEELISVKAVTNQYTNNFMKIEDLLGLWEKEWTKFRATTLNRQKVKSENPQSEIANSQLKEFLDSSITNVKSLKGKLAFLTKLAGNNHRYIGGTIDNLLMDTKKIMMLPFSSVLVTFPKMVHDISRDMGKKINLTHNGSELEIDRRILDEIKSPLIHLIRNCIDHGIEKPEERLQKNKPQQGTIRIIISQVTGNKVDILIKDDGRGIDLDKVRKAAVKKGMISETASTMLNRQEALSLIFQSDLSTSPIITDISGRGLGLAIVRDGIEKLGGYVSVKSSPQDGTTFQITLPLTIATLKGILIRVSDQNFILPIANVERIVRIKRSEIRTIENKETISLNGHSASFVRLNDILELSRNEKTVRGKEQKRNAEYPEFIQALILSHADTRIAFGVDNILGEQEVLVKSLGKQLSRVRNIANVSIDESGKIIAILNASDLIKTAVSMTVTPSIITGETENAGVKNKSILIADDSITSRMLLKNIVESAGYNAKVAVNGAEAFKALRDEEFDLVVSDVEMPMMSGFDLTSEIRKDKNLAHLPVVLVTSLESKEDRERGEDAGANAYIVKSSFDQSNLLDVIQRLI